MARILVVDDQSAIRTLLRRMLEPEGHEIAEATGGADALAQIDRTSFDVVITDMHMPEMDGIQFTSALRRVKNPPVIVAMSGNDVAMTLRMATMLGARITLPKPFNTADALAAVDDALAMAPDQGSDPARRA